MIPWQRLFLSAVLFVLPVAASAAVPTPSGPILPAKGHPAELQLDQDVFIAPSGHYVRMSWEFDPTTDDGLLYGQSFSADGTAQGERFLIDPTRSFRHFTSRPEVGLQRGVFLTDDVFAVAWAAIHAGEIPDLYVRVFNGDGSPRSDPRSLGEADFIDTLEIAAISDTGFAFTSTLDRGSDNIPYALYWVFDADGQGTVERRVGGVTPHPEDCDPLFGEGTLGIASTSDGDFEIAFTRIRRDEDDPAPVCPELPAGIFSRRFAPDGTPRGPEVKLADEDNCCLRTALFSPDDGWLVASVSSSAEGQRIFGQWFSPDGPPLSPEFDVTAPFSGSSTGLRASLTPEGTPVVAWRNSAPDTASETAEKLELRALEEDCSPGPTTLCLGGGRFRVEVDWLDFRNRQGSGSATPLSAETGYFTFFNGDNVELVVKVLDGQPRNGNFWVFYGALSNVRYRLTVTDTERGLQKVYDNPAQTFASTGDTAAFPGDGTSAPVQAGQLKPAEIAALLPGIPTDGPGLATAGESTEELSFHGGRFRASTTWRDFLDRSGSGQGTMLTEDTGYFWFFRPENVEVVVKVLDGRANNGHWWVFYGALTNVEYTLTVEDTENGTANEYFNPLRTFASDGDTTAFPD